jgi:hypothetical protein
VLAESTAALSTEIDVEHRGAAVAACKRLALYLLSPFRGDKDTAC